MLPFATPMTPARFLLVSALVLAALAAWDASGLDLPLARWFGDAQGFPLTRNWWLQHVMHTGARWLGWVVLAVLIWMIWRPAGPLRALSRGERIGLVLGVALAVLAVQVFKRISLTSCPWSLAEFGGVAAYVSHWRWGIRDGGSGHCFPAGHASTALCYLAGWFWLRPHAPRAARLWLLICLLAGLALGVVQMVRGAHYFSHMLWTGWVCWVAGGAFWLCVQMWKRRPAPPMAA
jgi:membrane-associated PAP2 superfamily phosphatase